MATFAPPDMHGSHTENENNVEIIEINSDPEPEEQENNLGNNVSNMEWESSLEIDPEKALKFKTEGNEAFKNQNFDSAMECYTKSLRHDPNNAKTLSNRSAVYFHFKEYMRAQEDANQAILLDSSFVKSYFRLGKCHVASGNLTQAKVMFEKALSFEPNNQGTLNEVKNCKALLNSQAKYEKAIEDCDFREAIYYIRQVITSVAIDS